MRPPVRLLLSCALAVLALPATAPAQSTAPPGNAGIDEYVETVPSATGNRSTRDRQSGGGALTPAQRRELEALGEDGRVLAETVEATAPAKTRKASTGGGTGAAPAAGAPAPGGAGGDSPIEAVVQAASGGASGGMGLLLPIILGATAALAVAVAVSRRRASR